MNKPLRVGILGCADIAWRRTLPAMLSNEAIEISAIASRDKERAVEFTGRFGGAPIGGYAGLLALDDIDAVYIPLPAMLHAEWVARALESGKHVLVEKPMTASYEETVRLIDVARSRGLVLLENYMFLYHSQHTAVRKLVTDGEIGELRSFSSAFTIPPKPTDDIRYQPSIGGGAFIDFGGYPVRVTQYFLAGDLQVVGAVFRHDRQRDVVMSGSVLLCDARGVSAQLNFGMENSYRNSYCLYGSKGRIALDRVFTPPEYHSPVLSVERQDHREELVLPADHQFANVISAFAHAVLSGCDVYAQQEASLRQAFLIEEIQRHALHVRV